MSDTVLAEVGCSGARRVMAVALVAGLGVTLLWLAAVEAPGSLPLRVALLTLGFGALVFAARVHRATAARLVLTPDLLRDDRGQILTRADDIAGIERGMFAFKPSNGFVLRLKKPQASAWQPGLWWRWGDRLAVGGVPSGRETRAMADAIQARLDAGGA